MLARAALLAAAALAPPLAARAQLLPDTGTTVQVDGLRQQLEGLLASGTGGNPTEPGWTVVPSLGVEQRWTDHLQGPGETSGSTFITELLPAVLINGQTSRSITTINYATALLYYSNNGDQNRIDQNLNALSQITLVPERLFIDLRGFAITQPVYAGYAPGSSTALARQGETETLVFSAHPYLRERFGDLGFAELGATVSRASQDGLPAIRTAGQTFAGTPAQNTISEQEYLSLSSGPDFGRSSVALSLTAGQNTGTGGVNDSSRSEAKLTLGYAITRQLTALAGLGYDTVHYGGTPAYNQSGPEWSGGLRWTPNPDSSISVSYGREQGLDSAQLDASYAPTARTHVYARYSEGIATGLEQLLNAMNAATLDPLGNPIAASNGAPLQIANSFYGVQNNLAQVTSASLTAMLLENRDSFSASLSHQERRQLAATTTSLTGPQDSSGSYASLGWQHDFWPNLHSALFAQWGTARNSIGSGRTRITETSNPLVFSLRLSYAVSPTLSAYAQYSWSSQSYLTESSLAGVLPLNQPASLVVLGARKSF